MFSKEKDNLIFIRLLHNEDVFEQVQDICRKYDVTTAVVLNGIGRMHHFEIGFFKAAGQYDKKQYNEPWELCCLAGNISKQPSGIYALHLHAILSDIEKKTVGGHLFAAKVDATNEIVLLKTDIRLMRQVDPATGLQSLLLED
ncbi:PPC domain-containing DNA-binding protein [Chloroflexota bacterium]